MRSGGPYYGYPVGTPRYVYYQPKQEQTEMSEFIEMGKGRWCAAAFFKQPIPTGDVPQ